MIVLQNMELDDDAKLDANQPIAMPEKPDYPYGLRICLTEKEFEKLGLDPKDAFRGGIIHGHFMGEITCCSTSDGEYGSSNRVEIQMTHLAIESEDAEDEESETVG